jgi:hypothetical protein
MGEMGNACKIFVGKPEGCRPLCKRVENGDNIEMYLKNIILKF